MKDLKTYYVYIITNKYQGVLYIGFTSNLVKRMQEHKTGKYKGFSQKYNLCSLVYYERLGDVGMSISREKQLKRWHRQWKINLIEKENEEWKDLTKELVS